MQYNAIPCNTMQYHASLITADGAPHCPLGSIMAIFIEDQCDLKSGGAGSVIGQFAVSASDGAYNYGDEE